MKNNILLILAVTVISIGIIIATVLISGAGKQPDNNSSASSDATTSAASEDSTTAQTPPEVTTSRTTSVATLPEPVESTEVPPHNDTAESIIATAHSLIGIDFVDGGASPDVGFDNSGFIYYVMRENGFMACPRDVYKQSQMGAARAYDELMPGDLVFFYAEDMATVSFGGIYTGSGTMIACLMPGTQVKEINITTSYYIKHFYRGVGTT
ncbi:MAG: C40 family peptidase [Oscillospiraceae bacterium]